MIDEQQRIRGDLQAQGAKLTPAEVIDKITAAMADLRRAALAVPAARFEERPAPDEWSAILDRERAALFDRVRAADPAAHLSETIEHGMFGPLNWRETMLFMRIHDLDHVGQLQKVAAALA